MRRCCRRRRLQRRPRRQPSPRLLNCCPSPSKTADGGGGGRAGECAEWRKWMCYCDEKAACYCCSAICSAELLLLTVKSWKMSRADDDGDGSDCVLGSSPRYLRPHHFHWWSRCSPASESNSVAGPVNWPVTPNQCPHFWAVCHPR